MSNEMNFETSIQLRETHIEMIRVFTDICKKENLTYFMLGGTMLGAVRHKGFIPWDDDTDFGMPRPDYDRFFKVAPRYLPPRYHVQHFESDKDYLFYAGRLVSEKMQMKVGYALESAVRDVWLDIFPLDGMPGNRFLRECHKARLLYQRMMFSLSRFHETVFINRVNRPWYEKVLIRCAMVVPVEKILSKEKRYQKLDSALRAVHYENAEFCVNMMGAYKFNEMFAKEVFGKGRLYDFEGMELVGPLDYRRYLTQLYGNYMEPPPLAERNHHATSSVRGGG